MKNVTASPLFNSNKKYGLGTFGTSEADNYTVHDGALAGITRAYPTPHSIARNFNLYVSIMMLCVLERALMHGGW